MRWMFLYIYIVGAYVLYADRISIIYYYYRKRASDLMFKYYDLHFIWIVCESSYLHLEYYFISKRFVVFIVVWRVKKYILFVSATL